MEPQTLKDYQRPPEQVPLDKIQDDSMDGVRKEMIKTYAVATTIYEDDLAEKTHLPFPYKTKQDKELLKEEIKRMSAITSLADTFGDFGKLELDLEESDLVPTS